MNKIKDNKMKDISEITIDWIIDIVKSMKSTQWIQKRYWDYRAKKYCIVGFIGYNINKSDAIVGSRTFDEFISKKYKVDVIANFTSYNDDAKTFSDARNKIVKALEIIRDHANE
jgi:hypothetical protein